MKKMTILFFLSLPTWALAQEEPASLMPTFGSMCAGADRLLKKESSFIPARTLEQPGELLGFWLSPKTNSVLFVRPRYSAHKKSKVSFPEDEFTLSIRSGTNAITRNFAASYGPFRVYGLDLDRDGKEEIVLEHGEGRGTFVHVQKLEVLKVDGRWFETLFEADLNGYIWDPDLHDPVSWERTYFWKSADRDNNMQLELRLIPPPKTPRYCGRAETLLILQNPKLLFTFRPDKDRFEIVQEEFRQLNEGPKNKSTNHH